MKVCPDCGNKTFYTSKEKGETYCRKCGLVIEENFIDLGREWEEYDEASLKKRRTGRPITYSDPEIATNIQYKDIKVLTNKNRWFRLMKWQRRTSVAIERNLRMALQEIKRIGSTLGLTDACEEEIARVYTLALRGGVLRGRHMETLIAGCTYAALKMQHAPKTLYEIEAVTGIKKKEIGRAYKQVCKALNTKTMPSDPTDYLEKIGGSLNLPAMVITRSFAIAEEARNKQLFSGKSPISLAAAIIYVASLELGVKRTQRDVADSAGITEVTIRNRYVEIMRVVHNKTNQEIKNLVFKKKLKKILKK